MALLTLSAGSCRYYKKEYGVWKPDNKFCYWLIKVSLLSWIAVWFGVVLLKDSVYTKK